MALKDHSVDPWYPLCIDTVYGGYFSDFNHQWQMEGAQNKMIVSQARHVWTCSKLAQFYPDSTQYRDYAHHGFELLAEVMWDPHYGGFHNLVDAKGALSLPHDDVVPKNAYGNAFAIYGLAAYYHLSEDPDALSLVKEAFRWLERHSYDTVYGGYFQFLDLDGSPRVDGFAGTPPKDQNSTIHLLEAFTELYHVWPNDTLRARLQELLVLVRDTITTDKGHMNLFFQRNWTPFSYQDSIELGHEENFHLDHVSFGHDIETAYLLLEASETLYGAHDSITLAKSKRMVDHTLRHGWDAQNGGIYDGGYYFQPDSITIVDDGKVWWAQAEALNSLLLMSQLFPQDPMQYYGKFEKQWEYINQYLLDDQNKGWYWGGLDQEPQHKNASKGQIWKVNYHTVRSLMNCANHLQQ